MGIYKDMTETVRNRDIKKRQNIILIIIYIILTIAVMSDILRIPNTSITFFRISIPLAVFIIMLFPKWIKRFMLISSGFFMLNIFYNLLFYKVYRTDLDFQLSEFLKYSILYVSIFIILILVCIVKEISGEEFEKEFMRWIKVVGMLLIAVLFLYDFIPDFFGSLPLDNPNNYGCYIAAVFPFYLLGAYKERKVIYLWAIGIGLVGLYINDSKISLFGVFFQVALLFFVMSSKTKGSFFIRRIAIPVLAVFGVFILIFVVNPSIHGYSLQGIISEPLRRILMNDPYPTYTASVSFRTNTTIFALSTLWRLKGLGIGAGNLGVVLKDQFPDINPAYTNALNATSMSLHNSWLEFMIDMGIVGIVLLLLPLIYAVRLYFGKYNMSYMEKLVLIFTISFPVWSLGPSGVYTQYFLFAVITFLVICRKDSDFGGHFEVAQVCSEENKKKDY